jgi:hypothetical protein
MEWGYKWEEFQDLEKEQKAFLLAVYRTKRQMEAALVYKQHEQQKRRARKNR